MRQDIAEALEAAESIKTSERLCIWASLICIIGCSTIAYYAPWILLVLGVSLIAIGMFHARRCEPNEAILRAFAKKRNWFYKPREELRRVTGYSRRKRFYSGPKLLSLEEIRKRIHAGYFCFDHPPASGEVPRKLPHNIRQPQVHQSRSPTKRLIIPPSHVTKSGRTQSDSPANVPTKKVDQDTEGHHGKVSDVKGPLKLPPLKPEFLETPSPEKANQGNKEEQERITEAQQSEEKIRLAELARKKLEEPRFRVFVGDTLTGLLSVKEILLMFQDGIVTLTNYGIEKGSPDFKQLGEFTDLSTLYKKLIIPIIKVLRNDYKRNPKEKEECIKFHGTICVICDFSFELEFGEIGQGYIEVHHLKPIADFKNSAVRIVNPITDLRPVCANCHRMLHTRNPPYSIEEMVQIRSKQKIN